LFFALTNVIEAVGAGGRWCSLLRGWVGVGGGIWLVIRIVFG